MAKYDPLETYLSRRGTEEIEIGFADVERIIGEMLPPSASRPQWWANETNATGHVQCRAWRARATTRSCCQTEKCSSGAAHARDAVSQTARLAK
jgi:hypothetical protein